MGGVVVVVVVAQEVFYVSPELRKSGSVCICCHMLMCLVSENNYLFISILGMSVGDVINICYHMMICLIPENTKVLITVLGILLGTLILDVLLLYGIHNVSSYLICYFTCSGFAS